jgi:hypothetical protein
MNSCSLEEILALILAKGHVDLQLGGNPVLKPRRLAAWSISCLEATMTCSFEEILA